MNQLAKAPSWLFYMAFFLFTAQLCKIKLWKCSDDFPQKVVNISKKFLKNIIITPALLGFQISVLLIFCFFLSVTKIRIIQD